MSIGAEIGKVLFKVACEELWKKISGTPSQKDMLEQLSSAIKGIDDRLSSIQTQIARIAFTAEWESFFKQAASIAADARTVQNELENLDNPDAHAAESLGEYYKRYVVGVDGSAKLVDLIDSYTKAKSETSQFITPLFDSWANHLLDKSSRDEITLRTYVEQMTALAALVVNSYLRLYYIFEACEAWNAKKTLLANDSAPTPSLGISRSDLRASIASKTANAWTAMEATFPQAFTLYHQLYVAKERPIYSIVQEQSHHALDASEGRDRSHSQGDLVLDAPAVYIDWKHQKNNVHQQWELSSADGNHIHIRTALGSRALLGVFRYGVHYVDSIDGFGGRHSSVHKKIDRDLISIGRDTDSRYRDQDDFDGRTTWEILITANRDYFMFKNRHTNCVLDGNASIEYRPRSYETYGLDKRLQLYATSQACPTNPFKKWSLSKI